VNSRGEADTLRRQNLELQQKNLDLQQEMMNINKEKLELQQQLMQQEKKVLALESDDKSEWNPSFAKQLCVVCASEEREAVSLPCLHLMTCKNCIESQTSCPACGKLLKGFLKIKTK
jgi:DNA repair exonuclease SbcCD ATPase subunit